jgi:hypothetical protein
MTAWRGCILLLNGFPQYINAVQRDMLLEHYGFTRGSTLFTIASVQTVEELHALIKARGDVRAVCFHEQHEEMGRAASGYPDVDFWLLSRNRNHQPIITPVSPPADPAPTAIGHGKDDLPSEGSSPGAAR